MYFCHILYILDTSPLSDTRFANIFSHSVDFLFIFFLYYPKVFLGSAEEEMSISHKIRQYRALLGFALLGEILWSARSQVEEVGQAGNMVGF